jgi:hypothetical protein
MTPTNFEPLQSVAPKLVQIGRSAEAALGDDPRAAMTHLRLFGEQLTVELLDHFGLSIFSEPQVDRLRRLHHQTDVGPHAIDALQTLRIEGNKAVHEIGDVSNRDAMKMLRAAVRLVKWYWTRFLKPRPPAPGDFVPPPAEGARAQLQLLRAQLEVERKERSETAEALERLTRLLDMPQVATHLGLEQSFRALDEALQARAAEFLQRFREEPIHTSWPLQPAPGALDDKVRFVRFEQLAVIVIESPRKDVLLMAHIAPEAAALAWAGTRQFEVHPVIGTLQVYDVAEANSASATFKAAETSLFEGFDDDALLSLGLPEALLPAVRSVRSEAELDALEPHLPPEAADGLFYLASGHSLEEALTALDRQKVPAAVDTGDFATAVVHPESQRSFLVVEDATDLDSVLRGTVEAWRLYLHPDQRKLVRMRAKGPVRVLGGAGTGKTVALMHRAKHLASEVFVAQTDRLLVTTYTRNLAADLEYHLKRLLKEEDASRVDVLNLHALASRLWSEHGDGRHLATDGQRTRAWELAFAEETQGLSESFYSTEWEQVIQGQEIATETGYLRARRENRGAQLNRGKRRAVWRVFAAYRAAMDQMNTLEMADQLRLLRERLEAGQIPRTYIAALADEVQDFGAPELRFLRALIARGPGDLFLVGDAHQRIYGHPVRMSRCGVEIVGRSRRLRVNYRTTSQIRALAVTALQGQAFDDLDGGQDNLDGYRSLRVGPEPVVATMATASEQRERVLQQVRAWLEDGEAEAVCVAAPTKSLVEDLKNHLEDNRIPVTVLETDSSARGEGVRLATFHRLKGLEFPRVMLTSVQEGLMPLRVRAYHELNELDREIWDQRQRCLLYVAASRARDELVITGHGTVSPFLRG